jgi:hypothetical protein
MVAEDALMSDETTRPDHLRSWQQFEQEAPDLAAAVRARFEATKHHVLATLRSDGAPRASGTEVIFSDGELLLGSMWKSVKALDLRRDGRFALHSNPGDGSMEGGDSKVSGVAVEITGPLHAKVEHDLQPPTPFHLFRLDVGQVVHSSLHPSGDRMVVQWWRPGAPVAAVERQ